MSKVDILVLFEHPEWQKPLFDALTTRGLSWAAFDLKEAAFDPAALPRAGLVFSQASPSAYVRGNARAVPLALSLLRAYAAAGTPVVNGERAFSLELSKTAQVALLDRLGIPAPRTLAFNDVDALARHLEGLRVPFPFPAVIKPDQGGSGARMHRVEDLGDVRRVVAEDPGLWSPDPVLLLQEYLPIDPARGIVRLEMLGEDLLYGMRVRAHGGFNLCPSEVCHPVDGAEGVCAVPETPAPPVEFEPYPEVPAAVVAQARRIMAAGGLDIGGIEYAEIDGRAVFYDVNANSNLRRSVAEAHGFDPFERVVDHLEHRLRAGRPAPLRAAG